MNSTLNWGPHTSTSMKSSANLLPRSPMAATSILLAAGSIAGLPLMWNVVARNEYRRHSIQRFLGSKQRGAYLLAAIIFFLSLGRDHLVNRAMRLNPQAIVVPTGFAAHAKAAGVALIAAGCTLVVSSFSRLGITGTYLGDYFGILLKERVTGFPFNVVEHPMYTGAVMNFVGNALYQNNLVGMLLSVFVAAVYVVASRFEGAFTTQIYANAEAAQRRRQQ